MKRRIVRGVKVNRKDRKECHGRGIRMNRTEDSPSQTCSTAQNLHTTRNCFCLKTPAGPIPPPTAPYRENALTSPGTSSLSSFPNAASGSAVCPPSAIPPLPFGPLAIATAHLGAPEPCGQYVIMSVGAWGLSSIMSVGGRIIRTEEPGERNDLFCSVHFTKDVPVACLVLICSVSFFCSVHCTKDVPVTCPGTPQDALQLCALH